MNLNDLKYDIEEQISQINKSFPYYSKLFSKISNGNDIVELEKLVTNVKIWFWISLTAITTILFFYSGVLLVGKLNGLDNSNIFSFLIMILSFAGVISFVFKCNNAINLLGNKIFLLRLINQME